MFNYFVKISDHKCSISPLNCSVQMPEFVAKTLSPIGLSEWVVISLLFMMCWPLHGYIISERL